MQYVLVDPAAYHADVQYKCPPMLYGIENLPTASNVVILLHARDNVAIARVALQLGQSVDAQGITLLAATAVPAGHKIATRAIATGEPVYRYGNLIGFANRPIQPGDHVHVHNLAFRELDTATVAPVEQPQASARHTSSATFLGYQRSDGRVGTRNYIAVVAASNCAAFTAELIAASFAQEALPENVDGVVAFPHGEGCAHSIGPDTDQLERTLKGVLDHPNVSSALILGLGCETNQIGNYLGRSDPVTDVPATLRGLTLQNPEERRPLWKRRARRYASLLIAPQPKNGPKCPLQKSFLA